MNCNYRNYTLRHGRNYIKLQQQETVTKTQKSIKAMKENSTTHGNDDVIIVSMDHRHH
jgi:hypothetical protein